MSTKKIQHNSKPFRCDWLCRKEIPRVRRASGRYVGHESSDTGTSSGRGVYLLPASAPCPACFLDVGVLGVQDSASHPRNSAARLLFHGLPFRMYKHRTRTGEFLKRKLRFFLEAPRRVCTSSFFFACVCVCVWCIARGLRCIGGENDKEEDAGLR